MADYPGGESVCTMTSLQDRTLNRSYLDSRDTATLCLNCLAGSPKEDRKVPDRTETQTTLLQAGT